MKVESKMIQAFVNSQLIQMIELLIFSPIGVKIKQTLGECIQTDKLNLWR